MDYRTFVIATLVGHSFLAVLGARLIWNKGYHPLWGVLLAGTTGCIGMCVIGALPLIPKDEIFYQPDMPEGIDVANGDDPAR